MEINTEIIPANEFLHTTATGELDFQRAENILLQAVGGPEQESLNILLDLREVTCTSLSPAQVWSLVQLLHEHHSLHWRKMALLLSRESPRTRAELFELCAKNRGFLVQAFDDFEKALHWLARPKGGKMSRESVDD